MMEVPKGMIVVMSKRPISLFLMLFLNILPPKKAAPYTQYIIKLQLVEVLLSP